MLHIHQKERARRLEREQGSSRDSTLHVVSTAPQGMYVGSRITDLPFLVSRLMEGTVREEVVDHYRTSVKIHCREALTLHAAPRP